jgi:hypothetical protein
MMEAAGPSKMAVNFYQTKRWNIPEDGLVHTRSCQNLKSHPVDTRLFIKEFLEL